MLSVLTAGVMELSPGGGRPVELAPGQPRARVANETRVANEI